MCAQSKSITYFFQFCFRQASKHFRRANELKNIPDVQTLCELGTNKISDMPQDNYIQISAVTGRAMLLQPSTAQGTHAIVALAHIRDASLYQPSV